MRRSLRLVFALICFGVCSESSAVNRRVCYNNWIACNGNCTTIPNKGKYQTCSRLCDVEYQFCHDLMNPPSTKNNIPNAGTTVAPFSKPGVTPGAKNVNPGEAATTTTTIGTVGTQTVNPGAAATTTTNAAPLSTPGKPPAANSNGISGHVPGGQPGRSNFRVQ